MAFRWGISSITFSGGEEVRLESGSVLILIGPNNGGKSRALRDIEGSFALPGSPRPVVPAVTVVREGTAELFLQWLEDHYPWHVGADGRRRLRTKGAQLALDRVDRVWQGGDDLREAHAFLVHRLGTEERLTITNRQASIAPYRDQPQAYIHVLQASDELGRRASEEVKRAFDVDLVINWAGGSRVWFHVGREPARDGIDDRVSQKYASELDRLPDLDSEGDGIRSFVGGLLAALCGAHRVLMIDEPEAFLHPPQARRLSAALARSAKELGRQLIIATHSADVVRGALEASQDVSVCSADVVPGALEASQEVSVCRITRETTSERDVNHASLLESKQLGELWSKPLLRSSAAFDGLFHEGVVVCEADADCRFYEAILRRMETAGRIDGAADLYFVHGGGKGQLGTLARAYKSLHTPTAVVADLDLLRNKDEIAGVIAALGGDPAEMSGLFNGVYSALSSCPPVTSFDDFLSGARAVLDDSEKAGQVTAEHRRALQALLEDQGAWTQAKQHGIAALRGGAMGNAEILLEDWAKIGLFLVPVGELECWWREGPAAKNEWFLAAMKKVTEDPSSMPGATDFMAKVCRSFGYETS
jgi:hypothetical protein